jgi:acetyl esterase/lipase
MRLIITFSFIALTFSSCSQTEISFDDISEVEVGLTTDIQESLNASNLLNVSYGDHPQQVFDIYLPEGRTRQKTKVIMVVHGGNWTNGDKSSMTNLVLDLKQNNPNHAIVNINYVLGSDSHFAFPNQFFDIKAAIDFIKSKRNEYSINPEIGLIGSSAGGHLALQYTYKYDTDNDVKFVGSLCGPTNFLDPYYNGVANQLIDTLVDIKYYQKQSLTNYLFTEYLKILSPTYNVYYTSKPTILFYGDTDMVVPLSNGVTLNDDLSIHNIETSLNIFEGGHGGWYTEAYNETLHTNLQAFITEHLFVSDL